MSHRIGVVFRRASARELGILVVGVALVVGGIGLAICSTLEPRGRASGGVADHGSPTSFAASPWLPASRGGEPR